MGLGTSCLRRMRDNGQKLNKGFRPGIKRRVFLHGLGSKEDMQPQSSEFLKTWLDRDWVCFILKHPSVLWILKDAKSCIQKRLEPGYRKVQDMDICRASGVLAPLLLRVDSKSKHPDRPHSLYLFYYNVGYPPLGLWGGMALQMLCLCPERLAPVFTMPHHEQDIPESLLNTADPFFTSGRHCWVSSCPN